MGVFYLEAVTAVEGKLLTARRCNFHFKETGEPRACALEKQTLEGLMGPEPGGSRLS